MSLKQIGKNIRKIRELRDYDQQYMAEQLGISQGQYSKIEQGQKDISILTLESIANILQVERTLLETLDINALLDAYMPNATTKGIRNEKTTYEMVVTLFEDHYNISPLPRNYYSG